MPGFNWPTNGAQIDGVPIIDAAGQSVTVNGNNARGRMNGSAHITVNTEVAGVVPILALASNLIFSPPVQSVSLVCGARSAGAGRITASVSFTATDSSGAVVSNPSGNRTTRVDTVKPWVQPLVCNAGTGQSIASLDIVVSQSGSNPAPASHFLGPMSYTAAAALAIGAGAAMPALTAAPVPSAPVSPASAKKKRAGKKGK